MYYSSLFDIHYLCHSKSDGLVDYNRWVLFSIYQTHIRQQQRVSSKRNTKVLGNFLYFSTHTVHHVYCYWKDMYVMMSLRGHRTVFIIFDYKKATRITQTSSGFIINYNSNQYRIKFHLEKSWLQYSLRIPHQRRILPRLGQTEGHSAASLRSGKGFQLYLV